MPKLFIVYLGGTLGKDRIGEDHEVVIVVAESQMGAMSKARSKWKGIGKAHVDRVVQVDQIDNYQIQLAPNLAPDLLTIEDDWSKLNPPLAKI